jgi:hypothetical protein
MRSQQDRQHQRGTRARHLRFCSLADLAFIGFFHRLCSFSAMERHAPSNIKHNGMASPM